MCACVDARQCMCVYVDARQCMSPRHSPIWPCRCLRGIHHDFNYTALNHLEWVMPWIIFNDALSYAVNDAFSYALSLKALPWIGCLVTCRESCLSFDKTIVQHHSLKPLAESSNCSNRFSWYTLCTPNQSVFTPTHMRLRLFSRSQSRMQHPSSTHIFLIRGAASTHVPYTTHLQHMFLIPHIYSTCSIYAPCRYCRICHIPLVLSRLSIAL